MGHGRRTSTTSASRAAFVGLCIVVLFLSGFGLWAVSASKNAADQVQRSSAIDNAYAAARDQVAAEEFWVTEYLLLLIPDFEELDRAGLRRSHAEAARQVTLALARAGRQGTPRDRALVGRLLDQHVRYLAAARRIFAAIDAGDRQRALAVELDEIDPTFSSIEARVERAAAAHRRSAEQSQARLNRVGDLTFTGALIGVPIGLVLLGLLGSRLWVYRRMEVLRLQNAALTDSLTGLANHRAFQERLESDVERHRRSGEPLSVVLLDLDGLKRVNDAHGHPMGDRRLRTLASRLASTARAGDGVFRIGGDEFAAILPGASAWQALRFVQRLQDRLGEAAATAGIGDLSHSNDKDGLVKCADLALVEAKRASRASMIYAAGLEPRAQAPDGEVTRHHLQTLAAALARAVDAKDSYTRSHCETVSELCGLIAGELGLPAQRIQQIRLAGLLHDVGKIGIPDSILQKPGRLTDEEFAVMKTHATLGHRIVSGTDLVEEAEWILHHHERPDGRGYPDGLSGDAVLLPSRTMLVADAFEAMTSDRPYRKGMSEADAFAELELHAGTQFDPGCVAALRRALGAPAPLPIADGLVAPVGGHAHPPLVSD